AGDGPAPASVRAVDDFAGGLLKLMRQHRLGLLSFGVRNDHAACTPAALTACTSSSTSTRSPTNTPPASSNWFHPSPKSLRSIAVFATNPIRSLPHGSLARPPYSTSRDTSRVTSRM